MINIMLIGCGPHAQRIYYPIIEEFQGKQEACLKALVELQSARQKVEAYVESRNIQPQASLFLPEQDPTQLHLSPDVARQLDMLVATHQINAIIISTEPLAHMSYAEWAIEKGLHILMDKPLSTKLSVSTSIDRANELYSDYAKLRKLYLQKQALNPDTSFHLMAQRRYHPAFKLARSLISEVFNATNCPVTSIQAFHSDGQWRMPHEIKDQHYHPYNQGYGKCSHSGYHSLDMIPWLIEAAEGSDKALDEVEIYTSFNRPSDFLHQINQSDYRKLFPNSEVLQSYNEQDFRNTFKSFGELDAFSNLTFKSRGATMTLASSNLVHNGFSQRNWADATGRDLYKGNGRIRHESYTIEQGPFQAIHIHSYQSKELNRDSIENQYKVGGEYHLDIHIFRNNTLFSNWKHYELVSIKDLDVPVLHGYSRGHQEDSRRKSVVELFEAVKGRLKNPTSDLLDHRRGITLMQGIYLSSANRCNGLNPVVTLDFNKHPQAE